MSGNLETLILRDTRANQPAAGRAGRLYYVTDESVWERDNGSAWEDVSTSANLSIYEYILIRDEKTANTAGGTFTSGAWRTRDLNTEVADTGSLASVGSNQITLAAGTYRCRISAPALGVDNHRAKLYDVTNAVDLILGTVEWSHNAAYAQTRSFIEGRFTLSGSTVLEVRHYSSGTRATSGFGIQMNVGVEVYTVAEFWKEP